MFEVHHFPVRLGQIKSSYGAARRPRDHVKATKLFDLARTRPTLPLYRPGKDLANSKQRLVKQPREFGYISRGKPARAYRRTRQPDYQLWSELGDS
jgi:hypothetical protein